MRAERIPLHIGHVDRHYFLIKDTKDLNTLSTSDFERFATNNDEFLSKLYNQDSKSPIYD